MNALGSDQPEQMAFTDHKGCATGDVKIPGVPADYDQFPGVELEEPMELPAPEDQVELP